MEKLTRFLITLVILIPFSSAVSIGASPGFIDLGEVEPGTTQEIDFYITTNNDEEFQVTPSYDFSTSYTEDSGSISMENVSEQRIDGWISWTEETYSINPNTSETYTLPDGSSVNAEGTITLEVDIPPNAEPGYRIGDIELSPSISSSGGGAGARVIGQTVPTFAFKVPGSVNRDIEMDNLQAVRIGQNSVQLIAQLRNTGTATTSLRKATANIYDEDGENLGGVIFDPATLAPGEYAEVDGTWKSENVEGGDYRVEGKGDFTTGQMLISDEFILTNNIQERQSVEEPSGGETEEQNDAPILMVVILSLLLGTLLYLMEVQLTWIIMLAGGAAVVLYILLSSVSNILLLIPLISIAIIQYI